MMRLLLYAVFLSCVIATLEPVNAVWASWIAFIPLLYLLYTSKNPFSSCGMGFLCGSIYGAAGTLWIIPYDPHVYWKASLLTGIPFAIFFGVVSFYSSVCTFRTTKGLILTLLFPSLVWAALLYIFQFTSVGPIPLEEPFHQPLFLLQLASLGGMWPISTLILTWSSAVALMCIRKDQASVFVVGATLVAVVFAAFWGAVRLHVNPDTVGDIDIALVQTNFPISDEWKSNSKDIIVDTYTELIDEASLHHPRIIILPQYSLPFDILREPETLERLAKKANAYLVLASYIPQYEGKPLDDGLYNVGFFISPTEGLVRYYNSVVGPPYRDIGQLFGETFPTFHSPAGTFGLLLCYEDTVRWVARKWTEKDVDYLVSLSNTGHFAGTVLPSYHIMQTRLRAIENHKPIVRVTPNGISGIFDAYGRIQTLSLADTQQILYGKIPLP